MKTHDVRLSENQIRVLMHALRPLNNHTITDLQREISLDLTDTDPDAYDTTNLLALFAGVLDDVDNLPADTLHSFVL